MPTVTTSSAGIVANNDADPKPVTGFNYAGQPMRPGEPYNGRPEHQQSHNESDNDQESPVSASAMRQTRSYTRSRKAKLSHWTAEKREAFGQRMREYWAKRKAEAGT